MLRHLFTAAVALTFVSSNVSAAPSSTAERNFTTLEHAQGSNAPVQLAQYYGNRVCCKRGYRDWWSSYRSCRRAGGYVVSNRYCFDDRVRPGGYQRVCCKRGYRDWWTTPRQCRRSGGSIVSTRYCRYG